MKQAIFTVVNGAWINQLNIFVESWYKDKPDDVDYILVHDGTIGLEDLNHKPDLMVELEEKWLNSLVKTEAHRFLKPSWKINCGRIFIMDLYKEKYDKLIYFDADTVVVDLQAFLNYHPQKSIAAVEAEFTRESISIVDDETGFGLTNKLRILEQRRLNPSGYVNNGVLIINTAKLRNLPFNISEVFIRTFGRLEFIDQDFINLVFSKDIEYLDRSYNFIPLPILRDSTGAVIQYGEATQNYFNKPLDRLKAIHYISGWRPWEPTEELKSEVLNVNKIVEIYNELIERTPKIYNMFRRSVKENSKYYIRK